MFAACRVAAYSTLLVLTASIVFALGVSVVTLVAVVAGQAANVVSDVLGHADPCASRGMLVDRCAPLDASRVDDLRPQAVAAAPEGTDPR
jgi:hypothetical protein